MGLIRAASDAVRGVLDDQWKDFYTVPDGLRPTAALFSAVPRGTAAGRGTNVWASPGVITDGSRIVVPEGYGLVLMQEGGITGVVTEPGAYEWHADSGDSRSIFAGADLRALLATSWERFKFGGRPLSQQLAFFVSLKELPNNRFGTMSAIYWHDAYLNAQAGAMARGTYTLRIADPILFVRNWVPATYLQPGAVFDFSDSGNAAAKQLFHEVVGSLAQSLALYANADPSHLNRMGGIQQNSVAITQSLAQAVESNHHWRSTRGLEIVSASIVSLDYDQATRELLASVQRADSLMGARGNSNLQSAVADALRSAGEHAGAPGILGLAVATGSAGLTGVQQPNTMPTSSSFVNASESEQELLEVLTRYKRLLDAGVITQGDYDALKAKALGL